MSMPPDSGEHVLDEPFMTGYVDDAEAVAVGKVQGREPEVERDAALFLFLQAVGVRAGEGLDQGRFPVVDMSGSAENDVFHIGTGSGSGVRIQDEQVKSRRFRVRSRVEHGDQVVNWLLTPGC